MVGGVLAEGTCGAPTTAHVTTAVRFLASSTAEVAGRRAIGTMAPAAAARLDGEAACAEVAANDNAVPAGRVAWYRNLHRYYDPAVGRYTQVDPLAESPPNVSTRRAIRTRLAYSYAFNNPAFFADPRGLDIYVFQEPGFPWHQGLYFDNESLDCGNACHGKGYVRVELQCAEYKAGGKWWQCITGATGVVKYNDVPVLSDYARSQIVYSCSPDCEHTHAALNVMLAGGCEPYSILGHECRSLVADAMAAAGCWPLRMPPGYMFDGG